MAAIPKNDGKIRLIHDASQPTGGALNDYAEKGRCVYESVKDANKIIKPNSVMGKIDLLNAYRTVKIHPRHQQWTGLKCRFDGDDHFTYMVDERLCFGARKSPSIFTQLTQAVIRILANMGHSGIVCYLDDFLISLVRYVRNMPKIKSSCQNWFYCFFDFIRGQISQKYWGSIFPAPQPRFTTHSKWPPSKSHIWL